MHGLLIGSVVAGVVTAMCAALTPASAGPTAGPAAAGAKPDRLEAYTANVRASQLPIIAEQGLDVTGQRQVKGGREVELVMSPSQADLLEAHGVDVELTRVKGGLTVRQFAAQQAASGFTVWRSYDEPGGIRDQLYAAARKNPQLVKLEVLGHTDQGREIIGVKMTQGAGDVPDGARPAVLYSSTQHAREWISTGGQPPVHEPLHQPVAGQRPGGHASSSRRPSCGSSWWPTPTATSTRSTDERLWRKNLRDNDGDGEITLGDGVDPNRNFPSHWGYDEEGSSSIPSSETYRGPAPASEPETQAMVGLLRPVGLRVPGQLPLRRPVAALRRGLADQHPDGRRPDLLRHVRQPATTRRSRTSTRA